MRYSWKPSADIVQHANISAFMSALSIPDIKTFHRYTTEQQDHFWQRVVKQLNIPFKKIPATICDLSQGLESPIWFNGAQLNIVDSCFTAKPNATALIYEDEHKNIINMTFAELEKLVNRIANSLIQLGFTKDDCIAIAMPMNSYAVAIYLAIIKMGGIVVSIADSFASDEIAQRLKIANTKVIFTQDYIERCGKQLPLYEKIQTANAPRAIVLSVTETTTHPIALRPNDIAWNTFLRSTDTYASIACSPMSAINILFSSGTTGTPKAIPWNHATAIKAASDAFFHQNIQAGDILAWPTSLGWMMGPWLIFAAFINAAAIALYTDVPKDRAFGEFVARTKVTMLGVVPTLVAYWRQTHCMENLDWHAIKIFSSTGECSNPDDMAYLMQLGDHKPVIEYCGGTEIGGAFVSSTVIEENIPSQFSTPTMGSDFIIVDEHGNPAEEGEIALRVPALGLSTQLLNADHHQIYFANMPHAPDGTLLRRHGDQIKRLANGYYMLLGRSDDAMNLGGIKVSAADIERALIGVDSLEETAAIAVAPPQHGPSLLVIFAVTTQPTNKTELMKEMQSRINTRLNPLFKIHDVVLVPELPKTASNKIMRRALRQNYGRF